MEKIAKQLAEEWGPNRSVSREDSVDRREVLARVKIFEILTGEELLQIERIVHRRVYRPREVVVRQGNPGVGMYIIQSGSVNVQLEAEEERVIHLATLGDGQFFGEMSLLDGAPRAASVTAIERSYIIGFFRADLMDLIYHSPRLGFKIVYQISQLMNQRLGDTLQEFRSVQRTLRELNRAAGGA